MRWLRVLLPFVLLTIAVEAQLLVPNQGIQGVVLIGDKREDVEQKLGPPDLVNPDYKTTCGYKAQGFLLDYSRGKVCEILVFDKRYRTAKGVHVGSTFAQAEAKYGPTRGISRSSSSLPGFETKMFGIAYMDLQMSFMTEWDKLGTSMAWGGLERPKELTGKVRIDQIRLFCRPSDPRLKLE